VRPTYRCAFDPRACPASGAIVVVDYADPTEARCPVCGRPLNMRPRWDKIGEHHLARFRTHRRLDEAIAKRETAKSQPVIRAARRALKAFKRGTRAAPLMVQTSFERVRALPPEVRGRERLLGELRGAYPPAGGRIPRSSKIATKEIEEASNIDFGAVEPDGWEEFLSAGLPDKEIRKVMRTREGLRIRDGIAATVRAAKGKHWVDLRTRPFVGSQSSAAWLSEFPGLEGLRLPDAAYFDADPVPF
jgi:hypothetical protein